MCLPLIDWIEHEILKEKSATTGLGGMAIKSHFDSHIACKSLFSKTENRKFLIPMRLADNSEQGCYSCP